MLDLCGIIFVVLSLRFYLCDFISAALYAGSLWLKFLPCCVYGARCTPGIFKHCFGVTRPNPPAAHTRSQQKQQKKVKAGKVYGKGLSVHPNQQKKKGTGAVAQLYQVPTVILS